MSRRRGPDPYLLRGPVGDLRPYPVVPQWGNSGLVKAGGWLGLVVAFLAAYLSFAEVCEASYGRAVLPLGPLGKH
jgi:hypothetical protein